MFETHEAVKGRLQTAAYTLLYLETQLEQAGELATVRKLIAEQEDEMSVKKMSAHRLSQWASSLSMRTSAAAAGAAVELKELKVREQALIKSMSLDESEANSESEQAIRSEIESLYQTLFEPLRYGIFPVEDQLRLQLQETTTVLLRKREILEELKEADPLLIQASGALDRVRNYEANGEKYASHGVVSSMILADTALHAAWSHLTDASFMNGVERLPELNFSSPIPHEQIKHIAADFLPAVKSLIASTAEYMKTMITDISRNAAVAAELEGRLQRERRRLILECAEDVDDTARRRGEPPQYDHVALETHSPPPSYEPG